MYGTRCLVRTTCPYPYELPPFLIVKLKKFFPIFKTLGSECRPKALFSLWCPGKERMLGLKQRRENQAG